jgi:hypothetical protein
VVLSLAGARLLVLGQVKGDGIHNFLTLSIHVFKGIVALPSKLIMLFQKYETKPPQSTNNKSIMIELNALFGYFLSYPSSSIDQISVMDFLCCIRKSMMKHQQKSGLEINLPFSFDMVILQCVLIY